MPTITTAEIAIVIAAILLLYVAPFLLTQLEASRRRREQPWASPATALESSAAPSSGPSVVNEAQGSLLTAAAIEPATECEAAATEVAFGDDFLPITKGDQDGFEGCEAGAREHFPLDLPFPKGEDTGILATNELTTIVEGDASGTTEARPAPAVPVQHVAPPPTAVAEPAPAAPASPATRFAGYEPPVATAFSGPDGYRFRLEYLHRARLADWPPAQVQSDPAGRQLWNEAEQLATACDAVLSATDLVAPCPVRSASLGACERRRAGTALHFLLFPDLWPAAPEQAVARVVFEIDPAGHLIGHAVDALASS
jgi:hypothetical protein